MSALSVETIAAAQELLFREALCLDTRRWDDWLALYDEDATFWMPAWTDEHRLSARTVDRVEVRARQCDGARVRPAVGPGQPATGERDDHH